MKLFTPDYYVESYRAIDLERLKRQGIALLVCDIDNTLVRARPCQSQMTMCAPSSDG